MKRPSPDNNLLSRLLALVLLLGSILVANHVHAEHEEYIEGENEQIENCYTYHQLQSHGQTSFHTVSIEISGEIVESTYTTSTHSQLSQVRPPARAPPTTS